MRNMFRNTMTRFLLVLAVLALFSGTLWAQGGTGELTGLVTDPTGAVVANAPITLTNRATGEQRTTVTTAAGTYRFPALPIVGTYTLQASSKGFRGVKLENIVISVGTATNHDIKLELGATSEQVTVEAGTQLVQTTESAVSDLVDRRVWQQMPLETRSQNEFINLLAGAVPSNIALNAANNGTDRGAAVNGTRSGTGNYLVEGYDNNDQGLGGGTSANLGGSSSPGGANTTISPDAIEEYRVIQHDFAAEYGKAGGFVTDTVLKSGTNQWHGSLYEYNRVQALAANHFFSNRNDVKDSLVRNQFGGSIGGPIVKDKTFFFFTSEFHRVRQATPVTAFSTTPDFLNFVHSGQFENFVENDPNGVCNNQNVLDGYAANLGAPAGTFPAAPCPDAFSFSHQLGPIFSNLAATQPFPLCVPGAANCRNLTNNGGGIITSGLGTNNGIFQGTIYPVPVYGLLTLVDPASVNQSRYTAKLDHRLDSKNQLSGVYLYDNADTLDHFGGGPVGAAGFGVTLPIHSRGMNAGITLSSTLTPTVLNQFRMGYVRHTANFLGDPSANAGAIPTIATFDALGVGFGNSPALPQFFTENEFQYRDDLSVTKGKHNFKGGAQYSRTRNGSSFNSESNGNFNPWAVEDLVTDSTFTDQVDALLAGGPALGSFAFAEASVDPTTGQRPIYYRGFRANEVAAYLQDDWRIHPRLTLNLGVRWEYFGPPHNFLPNIDSNFYTGVPVTPIVTTSNNPFFPINNPVFAGFATGTVQVKNNDIWHKDLNNWAPRVGFAWDALGTQKFVVRGGFGVAYDRMYNNVFENIRFNPPFFCFCNTGVLGSGVAAGNLATPNLFTVPFTSTSQFVNPANFPGGNLPKASPRAIDQNLVTAYYEQVSFGFQYQIAKDFVLETNYVGTFGHKLLGVINNNTFPGRTVGAGFSGARPNPTLSSINFRANDFSSNYHGFQTTLRKRFAHGLQFDANYTYSKVLDQVSDVFTTRTCVVAGCFKPEDSQNLHLDYGPADFDVTHRFVVSYSWEVPFAKTNRWLGGWTVSGIVSAQTGVPFSVVDSNFDANANGETGDRLSYLGTGAVTRAITGSSHPADGYFNPLLIADTTSCPTTPQNLGLWCQGGTGRNTLRGPGYYDWDLGIAKRFKINERAGVQFQANFFNLFNRANFALPGYDLAGGSFGSSVSTFDPRITQLALRFDF